MRLYRRLREATFLIAVFLLLINPLLPIRPVHADTPLAFDQFTFIDDCGAGVQCTSPAISITNGELIIVSVVGIGGVCANPALTLSDTQTNSYVQRQVVNSITVSSTLATATGTIQVRVLCGNFDSMMAVSTFTGTFNGFGASAGHSVDTENAAGSDTLTGNVLAGSIIVETFTFLNQNNLGINQCPTFTALNGQNLRRNVCGQTPGNSCNGSPCGIRTFTQDITNGGQGSLNLGNSWSGAQSQSMGQMRHSILELQTTPAAASQFATQCYGNCGNPAVTLVNTNSTHTVNFNQSLTLLYIFQSSQNGIIANVSTNLAIAQGANQILQLGVYEASGCAPNTQFSNACPGSLLSSITRQGPSKGKFTLPLAGAGVAGGTWVGIAVTAAYWHLDINDTNTAVPLFQANGAMIPQISSAPGFGPCSTCKMALWAYIIGNSGGTTTPPTPSGGSCGGIDCWLVGSTVNWCSNPTPNCVQSAAWLMVVILSFVSMFLLFAVANILGFHENMGSLGQSFVLFFVSWVFIFSGLNLLPIWAPITIILGAVGIFSWKTGIFEG